ncbi:MAG: hypothetical protein ACRDY1_01005 [Acidimicrobiales bacterium]
MALGLTLFLGSAGCSFGAAPAKGKGSIAVASASRCAEDMPITLRGVPTGFLATGVSSRGLIVVVGSSWEHPTGSFVVEALLPDCAPDRSFGIGGVAHIHLPPGADRRAFEIEAVAPSTHGSVLLAGSSGAAMMVARLLPRGVLDPGFGENGWLSLVPPDRRVSPEATALLQERSGLIVIAGDDGGCAACFRDWVTAATPRGRRDQAFGRKGWVTLFGDSSIVGLVARPGDGVVLMGEAGNMDCFSVSIAGLTSTGAMDRAFEHSFTSAWMRVEPRQSFDGTLVPGPSGSFRVVGITNNQCTASSDQIEASGLVAGFGATGTTDAGFAQPGVVEFAAHKGEWWSFSLPDGVVMTAVDSGGVYSLRPSPQVLTLRAFSSTGSVDQRFAEAGVRTISIPSVESEGQVVSVMGDGNNVVITSTVSDGPQVRVVDG